jgi:arabinan endo-1,5-alpha-L-arabinosidase
VRFTTVATLLLGLVGATPAPAIEDHASAANANGEHGAMYTNPVIDFDCADPGVAATGEATGAYVLSCTGGALRVLHSNDLVHWRDDGETILESGKASWSLDGERDWAPELHRVGTSWIAYFTAANAFGVLSIGAATASSADGPWTVGAKPLVEDPEGAIDATYFEDDDASKWLVYKIDSNARGLPTKLVARQLAADGLSFAGPPVDILSSDSSTWEGKVVEAPWVVKRDGTYYLFYSGNAYDHRYRTGVARAANLVGPYEKHGAPILANNDRWVGPGHGSVVTTGGEDWFVYHAWSNAGDGTAIAALGRMVLVDAIHWHDGWPSIHDGTPSTTPQAAPIDARLRISAR